MGVCVTRHGNGGCWQRWYRLGAGGVQLRKARGADSQPQTRFLINQHSDTSDLLGPQRRARDRRDLVMKSSSGPGRFWDVDCRVRPCLQKCSRTSAPSPPSSTTSPPPSPSTGRAPVCLLLQRLTRICLYFEGACLAPSFLAQACSVCNSQLTR
jgi:hypothetical protein